MLTVEEVGGIGLVPLVCHLEDWPQARRDDAQCEREPVDEVEHVVVQLCKQPHQHASRSAAIVAPIACTDCLLRVKRTMGMTISWTWRRISFWLSRDAMICERVEDYSPVEKATYGAEGLGGAHGRESLVLGGDVTIAVRHADVRLVRLLGGCVRHQAHVGLALVDAASETHRHRTNRRAPDAS